MQLKTHLMAMKKFYTEEKNEFFLDSMWVDSNLIPEVFARAWWLKGVITVNASSRFILLNTDLKNQFLPGAHLLHKSR